MTEHWMTDPHLIAWFDDLEDAVTTALALPPNERRTVRASMAPRDSTWMMMAADGRSRDGLRALLSDAQHYVAVPTASDCNVLDWRDSFVYEEDAFDRDNGFETVEVHYCEDGSAEQLKAELLSDAEDYAASSESGWFYTLNDEQSDDE